MRKLRIVAMFILCAAVSVAVYAQQKKGPSLTAQDYAEIQQLYIRYNFGIDTRAENGMAWAGTFTVDGEFINGSTTIKGHEKLAEFAKPRPNMAGAGAPHHFATNIMIEPSPEGARGSAYFFNVPTPEPGKPAAITGTGTYQDVIVKTADGWRFKTRTFFSNRLPPSMLTQTSAR